MTGAIFGNGPGMLGSPPVSRREYESHAPERAEKNALDDHQRLKNMAKANRLSRTTLRNIKKLVPRLTDEDRQELIRSLREDRWPIG